jgi:hypothetical protein
MSNPISYDQVRRHRLKKEIDRINDLLAEHFSETDRPITITILDIFKDELLKEYRKGWDIAHEETLYGDDKTIYRFGPKHGHDDDDLTDY